MVAKLAQVMAEVEAGDRPAYSPPPAQRRWRLVDRLGEQMLAELVRERRQGATPQQLAETYGISLSSVKQVLRGRRSQGGD